MIPCTVELHRYELSSSKSSDEDVPLVKLKKKNVPKTKSRHPLPVCLLCGAKFQTNTELKEHQKTHLTSPTSYSPVFPCQICGRHVKNLKIHLRIHKNGSKQPLPNRKAKGVKTGRRPKSDKYRKPNAACTKLVEPLDTIAVETTAVVGLTPAVVPSDTPVEHVVASSSTDAIFSKLPCDNPEKGTETEALNQAFTNSNESLCILTDADESPVSSHQFAQPSSSTAPAIDPSYIVDVKTEKYELSEYVAVNTPLYKCPKCPGFFRTPALLEMHFKKHDEKSNCAFCGKVLAKSYVMTHINKYHKQ